MTRNHTTIGRPQVQINNTPLHQYSSDPGGNISDTFSERYIYKLFIAHVALGILLRFIPSLSPLHSIGAFVYGLILIFGNKKRAPIEMVYVLAYIAGSEIMWRMTKGNLLWEYGKYSSAGLCILALFRFRLFIRARKGIFFYFLLLLPSTIYAVDFPDVSFNLTGPLSLAVITMFMSAMIISRKEMQKILIWSILPVTATTVIVLLKMGGAGSISFGGATNIHASGGIGGNQVSSALGLGAVAAFLFSLIAKEYPKLRKFMIFLAIWFLGQAALTFSRGGVMTAVGAMMICFLYLVRDKKGKYGNLLRFGIITLLLGSIVYPFLDDYTGGALTERYAPTSQLRQKKYTTNRDKLAELQFEAFRENPLFGAGPGAIKDPEGIFENDRIISHTEYTRLIGDHGLFGVVSLLIFLYVALSCITRKTPRFEKGYSASMLTWCLLYMLHQSMRLVAASFTFGFAAATLDLRLFEDNENAQSVDKNSNAAV